MRPISLVIWMKPFQFYVAAAIFTRQYGFSPLSRLRKVDYHDLFSTLNNFKGLFILRRRKFENAIEINGHFEFMFEINWNKKITGWVFSFFASTLYLSNYMYDTWGNVNLSKRRRKTSLPGFFANLHVKLLLIQSNNVHCSFEARLGRQQGNIKHEKTWKSTKR